MAKDARVTITTGKADEAAWDKEAMVAIVAPSLKLLERMSDAAVALKLFGVNYSFSIVAAHRAPKKTLQFASEIESSSQVQVIIAGGTGSAHLPGALASLTTIPVIGIPLKGEALEGMDSLYSMLQMPSGVPVATIGIDASFNAGMLACLILSLKYPALKARLLKYREKLEHEVWVEDSKLQTDLQRKKNENVRKVEEEGKEGRLEHSEARGK